MKKIFASIVLLGLFLTLIAPAARAQSSLETVFTFSYPESDVTYPTGIDNKGNIVGYAVKKGTVLPRGFIRHPDGTFAPLLEPPNPRVAETLFNGINDRQVLIGNFLDSSANSHAFFSQHDRVRRFKIPDARSTFLTGLNDAKDFAGYVDTQNQSRQGFISIGGVLTMFANPGVGTDFRTGGLNNSGALVGNFEDFQGTHGFLRDQAGNYTTIDMPGATDSYLLGLNNHREMVGYFSGSRAFSGFYFKSPDTFIRFNHFGQSYTVLTAINDDGMICGIYRDHHFKTYRALVARVSPAN
jgi:hypothetical protein